MQEILKVINLTKNYLKNDHDFKALDDINFTLQKAIALPLSAKVAVANLH